MHHFIHIFPFRLDSEEGRLSRQLNKSSKDKPRQWHRHTLSGLSGPLVDRQGANYYAKKSYHSVLCKARLSEMSCPMQHDPHRPARGSEPQAL
jgi:hypothetical protein